MCYSVSVVITSATYTYSEMCQVGCKPYFLTVSVAGRCGRALPSLSSQQSLQPGLGSVVNVAGSSRNPDRVVLVVDDTRFIVDLDALKAYPNTMLGRSVM